jgi:drug/metabolite transporter (DMT)-like permease
MIGRSAWLAVLLAIAGGVVYHISAKSVPGDAVPTRVLLVAYLTALAITGIAYLVLPLQRGAAPLSRLLHPAVFGLGIGAAMIELGYVLAYRAAFPVSGTSLLVNSVVATLLVPVGLIAFAEHMSIARMVGMLLCFLGVWLLRH